MPAKNKSLLSAVPLWVLGGAGGSLLALCVFGGMALFSPSSQRDAPPSRLSSMYSLGGYPAPNFSLVDQFGKRRMLSSFRGHEVVLAFVDAKCTSVCPLTAEQLFDAKERLGASRTKVSLLAVNANPIANSVRNVRTWSLQHNMLHRWEFLTGPASKLRLVYHLYRVQDSVGRNGAVTHDAAVIIIDAHGRERYYSETMPTKSGPLVRVQEQALALAMRQSLPKA